VVNGSRLRVLSWALAVWAALVAVRLVQVQVVDHRFWEAESMRQREKTVEVDEPRGDIWSSDGHLLAGSLDRVAIVANPRKVPRKRWPEVAERLAPLVGQTPHAVLAQFAEKDGFFYLAKDLDPSVSEPVAKLGLRGVGTLPTERRVYPLGALAGPTVGFVDGDGIGQAGLEATFDRTLRGVPSVYRQLRDGKKTLPTPLDLRLETPGRPGRSLVLSLDARVQELVEAELEDTFDTVRAKSASAVVMDVRTGELLALASLPSYDPGRLADTSPAQRHNHAVEDALEPGSTFKPFIVASAFGAGVLSPNELVDCSGGGVQVANVFMRDHARFGLLPVREVLAKSSNAGAIRIALRLAPAQLDATIRAFGFGEPTRIELPAETRGIYRPLRSWTAVSRAGLALGQEISVTTIQLARAYAVIANGGLLVQPSLVVETHDRDGRVVAPNHPPAPVRVISPQTAATIAGMLEAVVDEGTGRSAEVPGFRVAGKTGTAQRAFSGGYSSGRHVAWFAGFLPQPTPRYVIVVCFNQPQADYWAAEVAAPTFGRIANRLVTLLGMTPTEWRKA
jgi:cell division protein FtsI (penicillin-binding protein 3)